MTQGLHSAAYMSMTTQALKYQKKPVVIDAINYTGENVNDIARVFPDMSYSNLGGVFQIVTLEGNHIATRGDWIIKGIKGEYYPCKPDIFAATYEPA